MSYSVRRVSSTANAMVGILGAINRLKQLPPPDRARSFYVKKALRFINLALQALEETPDGKGLRASCIALEAMCGLVKTSAVPSDEKPEELLQKFSLFLTRLVEQGGELSEEELKTAGQLLEFFLQIDRAGDEIDFSFPA